MTMRPKWWQMFRLLMARLIDYRFMADKNTNHTDCKAPAPFKESIRRGPFTTHNGPWFHWAEGQHFRQGVRVVARHCNSRNIAHGGFLSALADGLAATAVFRELGRGSVTIKLTTEFLQPVREGDWLQGTAHISRATRDIAFVEAMAWVGEGRDMPDDGFAFTCAAIFRLFEKTD